MSHGRTVCKVCDKVLESCRCMEAEHNVKLVVCTECEITGRGASSDLEFAGPDHTHEFTEEGKYYLKCRHCPAWKARR